MANNMQEYNLNFTYQQDKIKQLNDKYKFISDQNRAFFIAEKMRVDFVYNTAALEGNPYTYPEIKTLIEGITVGGHKVSDTEQVLNLNHALSHLINLVKQNKFILNKQTACDIQGIVANREALTWGKFRDGQVFIGGTDYTPPKAHQLDDVFIVGIHKINTIEQNNNFNLVLKAWIIFLWGSINQFFYDGNKRTSRLLANGVLLSEGLPPLTIFAKDQLKYNQIMTNFYNTQDATQAIEWLFEYYYNNICDFGFAEKL
jgi:Fic family protein